MKNVFEVSFRWLIGYRNSVRFRSDLKASSRIIGLSLRYSVPLPCCRFEVNRPQVNLIGCAIDFEWSLSIHL